MKNKRRPKSVEDMLEQVNEYLRFHKIKEEYNDLFAFMCDYLLQKNMYRGFNFYYTANYNGVDYPVLAGKQRYDNGEWEYLQIY